MGEQAAVELLVGLGYAVIERNFRTRYGELDIVAGNERSLVFCEVRSRVGRDAIAWALESVGPAKRIQLRRMATEWFRLRAPDQRAGRAVRFDVVAVAMTAAGRVLQIEHVRDAF